MNSRTLNRILSMITIALALAPRAQSAEEFTTLTSEGTTKATTPLEATREIQTAVTAEIARAQILEIMGERRYLKNKALVESKIVRQSAKFIPFVSAATPVQQPDGTWKMSVELKLSKSSLRKMILDAGLLNDAEGPASILPMIAFIDRQKGITIRWWQGDPKDESKKFLSQISALVHDQIQAEFSRQGFHVIKPLGLQVSPLPDQYRVDRPAAADLIFIGDYFNASMIMRGDVRLRPSKDTAGVWLAAIKVEVVQAASGRTVAEVSRHMETDSAGFESAIRAKFKSELPEISKDLATQVLEAWQRGTLNSNLIRLAVRGNLSAKQTHEFKSGLIQNVREIKSLKERAFESGQILFEADYSGEPGLLAERLKAVKMPAFETKVTDASDKGISLEVKTR